MKTIGIIITLIAYVSAGIEGNRYAWQEYNVSPSDTIWFADFLVIDADTLSYVEVYGISWDYAWQEYNVSPSDTIWFDDFLVVGSDTLSYGGYYSEEGLMVPGFGIAGLEIFITGFAGGFYAGVCLSTEDIWKIMADPQTMIEYIRTQSEDNATRPLYTYYIGLPPQFTGLSRSRNRRTANERERTTENDSPLRSAIHSLFSF